MAEDVSPPPDHVDRLMRDLVRFANTSRLDPVAVPQSSTLSSREL